jgi:4-methyl-5(b-hydroxyethyl)-thiazole monophosphate biosynthesis
MMSIKEKIKVCVLLGENLETIECVVPVDIWRYAGLKVTMASCTGLLQVRGVKGIAILADEYLKDAEVSSDVLYIPGGSDSIESFRKNPFVISKIQAYDREKKLIVAICAAPILLLEAGVLQGRRHTAYPCKELPLADHSMPVVWDQHILTGRDPGAVFLLALQLLKIIHPSSPHMKHLVEGMGLSGIWRLR